eukprot:1196005-Prorocentrum_minimum.AAC.5
MVCRRQKVGCTNRSWYASSLRRNHPGGQIAPPNRFYEESKSLMGLHVLQGPKGWLHQPKSRADAEPRGCDRVAGDDPTDTAVVLVQRPRARAIGRELHPAGPHPTFGYLLRRRCLPRQHRRAVAQGWLPGANQY